MEVISSPAIISRDCLSTSQAAPHGVSPAAHSCDICYCYTDKYITTPCKHKCCSNCYLKIDKCHMCRAPLPQVFKVD